MRVTLIGVTNEMVAEYHELLTWLARRYDGYHNAEFDDLYQEGAIAVITALQRGKLVASEFVAKAMMRWVNKCARSGLGYDNDPLLRRVDNEELLG